MCRCVDRGSLVPSGEEVDGFGVPRGGGGQRDPTKEVEDGGVGDEGHNPNKDEVPEETRTNSRRTPPPGHLGTGFYPTGKSCVDGL